MNKDIMRAMGYDKEVDRVEADLSTLWKADRPEEV